MEQRALARRCAWMERASWRYAIVNLAAHGASQDRAGVFLADGGRTAVVLLADGAGGMAGGGEAAQAVLDAAAALVSAGVPTAPDQCTAWLGALDAALARRNDVGQTTAVLLVATPRAAFGASVGDSEAWCIAASGAANLTAHQRRKPMLGSGAATPVPFATPRTAARFVVATDGLFKYAPPEQWAGVAAGAPFDQCASRLVELARLPRGGLQDDIAIVVLEASR